MKLKVRGFWLNSADFQLESYQPTDKNFFSLWINMSVGSDSDIGTNDYQLLVCTPDWIKKECELVKAMWGRHILIVSSYDLALIQKMICDYVENCTGKDFYEIAEKISRIAAWEYEDYQES